MNSTGYRPITTLLSSKENAMTTLRSVILLTVLISSGLTVRAQDTQVTWSTFTSGFGEFTNGNTVAQVVAGQPFAGELEGPGISVGGGFLYNPAITGQQAAVLVSLIEGWNMVSNPVTRAEGTDSVHSLFPNATYDYGFVFIPGVGYQQRYTLENRIGYWVKFPNPQSVSVFGTARHADTIAVSRGWNMVGSISVPLDTALVVSIPPNNNISPWFGYSGSLAPVEQLLPGHAYWVKAETTGVFIFDSSVKAKQSGSVRRVRGKEAPSSGQDARQH